MQAIGTNTTRIALNLAITTAVTGIVTGLMLVQVLFLFAYVVHRSSQSVAGCESSALQVVKQCPGGLYPLSW